MRLPGHNAVSSLVCMASFVTLVAFATTRPAFAQGSVQVDFTNGQGNPDSTNIDTNPNPNGGPPVGQGGINTSYSDTNEGSKSIVVVPVADPTLILTQTQQNFSNSDWYVYVMTLDDAAPGNGVGFADLYTGNAITDPQQRITTSSVLHNITFSNPTGESVLFTPLTGGPSTAYSLYKTLTFSSANRDDFVPIQGRDVFTFAAIYPTASASKPNGYKTTIFAGISAAPEPGSVALLGMCSLLPLGGIASRFCRRKVTL